MADVAKTVKVVSNNSACGVSLCELTSANVEADSLEIRNSPSNNTDSTDLTLNLPPSDDETSLQELIESELALRKELIDAQFSPRISDYSDTLEEADDTDTIDANQKTCDSIKSSPTILSPRSYDETGRKALDINTQFILAERNHSFQTFTGNDMFFFNTLDDTQINGTDPYLKDDEGLADPFLGEESNAVYSDIESTQEPNELEICSTSHVDDLDECRQESSESDSSILKDVDHITLSTFDPFTTIVDSSKSETIDNPDIVETPSSECADSDFICLQVETGDKFDTVVEPSQNLNENFGACDCIETISEEVVPDGDFRTNYVVSVGLSNSMDEFGCGNNDHVTNVFDTLEIDDYEIPVTPEEATAEITEEHGKFKITIPEIDIIPPDDNEISESELVSNEELSISSSGAGPQIELTGPLVEDGFETWETVAEPSGRIPERSDSLEYVPEEFGGGTEVANVHADEIVSEVCPKNTDSSYSDVSLMLCVNLTLLDCVCC